jgi:hypothetical protein
MLVPPERAGQSSADASRPKMRQAVRAASVFARADNSDNSDAEALEDVVSRLSYLSEYKSVRWSRAMPGRGMHAIGCLR